MNKGRKRRAQRLIAGIHILLAHRPLPVAYCLNRFLLLKLLVAYCL
jgi:hypothetical protein